MKTSVIRTTEGAAMGVESGSSPPEFDYVTRVFDHPLAVAPQAWQALACAELRQGRDVQPFMTQAYLAALHDSGSAVATTGWTLQLVTLWKAGELAAACPLYLKPHSYGEYVFDWAWADAYARHGLPYYPKGVVAVPFTPVPGPRLLAVDARTRLALVHALVQLAGEHHLSSLHLLFAHEQDLQAAQQAGLMLRHTVQFHWQNAAPAAPQLATSLASTSAAPPPFRNFDDFLATLSQEKRKKIKQERRKVSDAGVRFRVCEGAAITPADWAFFYRCYERTYLEHGNAPYLSPDFFALLALHQSEHWVMFVAQRADPATGLTVPIAASLVALNAPPPSTTPPSEPQMNGALTPSASCDVVAYGRYWGALERVDCLHFEACYYQPLQWCIERGVSRFEGGAQGEHKMSRALMPVRTTSAHWLAHPAFSDAIERYLERESVGVAHYMDDLAQRSPFRPQAG